ncbi:hypothetical protein [Microbacterium sp. CFBP9034]|uniref:PH-like domain-containing protein n=1 Tax=Microbacterium sp. CFBP9034 TaxID=3096540 RepID=UPI002A6AE167|nr:hypothetical protein [Microbacterium sp. CFBP9034]MDY0909783.1 hypothetical protein [Microbacterium sp. CFBP9034]
MTREGALTVIVAVVVVLIGLGVWAWRRRTRRDAAPLIQPGELPADAAIVATFDALYVATTKHDTPLERIAAPGLGFRSKAGVTVADAGVAIDLTGQDRFVLTTDRIVDAGQSTVAIDRVVEPGGLVRIAWRTDAHTVVDSYFRPQDAPARALADAVSGILTSTQTGTDE